MPLVAALVALLVLLPAPAQAAARWVWPLAGGQQVSRPFALGPTVYAAGHRGADLPGRTGQAVLAAGAGRVSYAGLLAGRDVLVVVHGALRTTYEPVRAAVGVGQSVAAGQQIGTLMAGHAGCPAAACLHWGLRRGADYLDPVRLVRGGPVRLLPLGVPAPPAVGLPGGQEPARLLTPAAGPSPAGAGAAAGVVDGARPAPRREGTSPTRGGNTQTANGLGAGDVGTGGSAASPLGAPTAGDLVAGDVGADETTTQRPDARAARDLGTGSGSTGGRPDRVLPVPASSGPSPLLPAGAGLAAATAVLAVRRHRRGGP